MLNINSKVTTGKFKGKTVKHIIDTDKKEIFNLIKQGLMFDDNVLSLAGIIKNIRDVKVVQVFTEHIKDNRTYEKETVSLSKILKEIRTIDLESDAIEENTQTSNTGDEYNEMDI